MTYLIEAELVEDARKAAEAMSVVYERIGQRDARKAGTDRGVVDVIMYANGRVALCEFKRSDGGRFSLDQMVAAEKRRAVGIETYAPSRLQHAVALMNWLRCGTGAVCVDCPRVPGP